MITFNPKNSGVPTPATGKLIVFEDNTASPLLKQNSDAGTQSIFTPEQFITLTSTNTLTSQTAAQPIFDGGGGPANGQVTLIANTTFFFECMFSLSAMSASSGTFGFALGGTANISGQAWTATANKATLATQVAWTSSWNTAANTALTAANTNTIAAALIWGKIRITTAGTLIPQVSLGVAAAAVVGVDSYFRIWPIGSNTIVTVGNWS